MPEKAASAKKLLVDLNLPLDASSLNNGLILAGMMQITRYLSTTGSGEEKYFIQFTADGLDYGKNKPSGWHEFKTEPVFYVSQFAQAYLLAASSIYNHALAVTTPPEPGTTG